MLVALLWSFSASCSGLQIPEPPILEVTADNTQIHQSCLIRIAPGLVLADTDGNGVLHIMADGITVQFAQGTVLRGAADEAPGDTLKGIGVRVHGHSAVTLSNMEISGFRCGILATETYGIKVHDVSLHHNFRQRLKSTPTAEDSSDWLWPHENDQQQWRKNYGAGLCVERSDFAEILRVKARHQQNGIILDRVNHATVRDCNCSFLSGWGLALWRSSENEITHNAFDFDIRGYSHGVYNRGQDSAGILMFEQCSENLFSQNSVTHGGDGIFAFSGKEALGETPAPSKDFSYKRRGNNDNQFRGNNLSYSAAHGLELTFGFGNVIEENIFYENAICGFWGGYSQETQIRNNQFRANGTAGYGLERGGINIDHSRNNVIDGNYMESTTCGVHLWSFPSSLTQTPWGRANQMVADGNRIQLNTMADGVLAVQLRGEVFASHYQNHSPQNTDLVVDISAESSWDKGADPQVEQAPGQRIAAMQNPERSYLAPAILALGGREAIIMTEWGPWDHQAPLLRQVSSVGVRHEYDLLPVGTEVEFAFADPVSASSYGLQLQVIDGHAVVIAGNKGYAEYQLLAKTKTATLAAQSWFLIADWRVKVFHSPCDPRENVETWRAAAAEAAALSFLAEQLIFVYGSHGPGSLPQLKGVATELGNDAFGTIATTSLQLQPGLWRFQTRSDDGVRVLVDGEVLLENWTWHGPTEDEAILEVVGGRTLEIVVEHFELDGYATLELRIEPVPE